MPPQPLLTTPLTDWHRAHKGRMVEFGGWLMPLQYRSIIEEHQAVRSCVGLFDITHMGRLTFSGSGALDWLEWTTTNQVSRLTEGQIQYSLLLNDDGGIIDDILVYRAPQLYSIVCNASNRAAVVDRFLQNRPASAASAEFQDLTLDTAMIAVQGPGALEVVPPLCSVPVSPLRYYHSTLAQVAGAEAVISRTGYTGEDGFEITVPASKALEVWNALLEQGQPLDILSCGLGARDTLRFEAAMPLYGHELSEQVGPHEAGVSWAVKPKKGDFLGREAMLRRAEACHQARVGLALPGRKMARQGYTVLKDGEPVGQVTSGTFAPTLQHSLAMAIVASEHAAVGSRLEVDLRGTPEPAEVVPLPFYRRDRHLASALEQPRP